MRRKSVDLCAAVVAAIMEKPCGAKQVCLEIGIEVHKTDRVKPFIDAFRAKGLIYIAGYNNWGWPIYSWQSKPWENADVVKPIGRAATKRMIQEMRDALETESMPRRAYVGPHGPNSVFSLGVA